MSSGGYPGFITNCLVVLAAGVEAKTVTSLIYFIDRVRVRFYSM
jgi:hypothetical protein